MSANTLPPKAVLRNIFRTEKEKAGKCELLCLDYINDISCPNVMCAATSGVRVSPPYEDNAALSECLRDRGLNAAFLGRHRLLYNM